MTAGVIEGDVSRRDARRGLGMRVWALEVAFSLFWCEGCPGGPGSRLPTARAAGGVRGQHRHRARLGSASFLALRNP